MAHLPNYSMSDDLLKVNKMPVTGTELKKLLLKLK